MLGCAAIELIYTIAGDATRIVLRRIQVKLRAKVATWREQDPMRKEREPQDVIERIHALEGCRTSDSASSDEVAACCLEWRWS